MTPNDFIASAGSGGDDRIAIQAAIDFVGKRGGGTVQGVPGKTYKVNSVSTYATEGGANKAALLVRYNGVTVDLDLFLNSATATQMYYLSGMAKANAAAALPTARDSRNYAGTFNSANSTWTLVPILATGEGQTFIPLTNPADAAKFRVGDWVMLRRGGTLLAGEPSSYETPFGQYSKVTAVSAAGVTIDRPLVWAMQADTYPVGHDSAGQTVPWGIINLSWPVNAMLENVTIKGNVEMRGHADHKVLISNFNQGCHLGTTDDPLTVQTDGGVFSMGLSRSEVHVVVTEAGGLLSNDRAWVVCNDSCNHEVTWDVQAAGATLYCHMHEGTTGNTIVATMHSTAQWREMGGFRAYAKNNSVAMNLTGLDPSWPGLRLDESTSGIVGALDAVAPNTLAALVNDGTSNNVVVTLH